MEYKGAAKKRKKTRLQLIGFSITFSFFFFLTLLLRLINSVYFDVYGTDTCNHIVDNHYKIGVDERNVTVVITADTFHKWAVFCLHLVFARWKQSPPKPRNSFSLENLFCAIFC